MGTLNVYWDGDLVGHLEPAPARGMTFRYAEPWLGSARARAISLSLPLRAEPFSDAAAGSWFANLLPEGDVRSQVARRLGISERNDFALLGAIGGDCAGALQLLPGAAPAPRAVELKPLPWDELEAKIAGAPRPSLLALVLQDRELRLSLAGAQDKLPVHLDGDVLSLPGGHAASTHLLKTGGGHFPDLVQNEMFCLALARAVGMAVPDARMAATKTPVLIVTRYDRAVSHDGTVRRLHQEDFCQALGLPPDQKYENEGGPPLARLFDVVTRGSLAPLRDRRRLLEWVLFNIIIGNDDAHAKNLSLLYEAADNSLPRLAPFYDLVCTAVYDQLSDRHAQKIGGEYRWRHVVSRHWDRLAEDLDIKPRFLRTVGASLCDGIATHAAPIAADIGRAHQGTATLARIVQLIEERTGRLGLEFSR